ncbi:MAG: NAD(P)-dependent glycerol-3-phosphate dehydrogenase [Bacteroidia bacterium]|nr:MAG: NAD(P)-dependent glycerol-3-phosphate dehydrogenase [Bacteroidia bacterium]
MKVGILGAGSWGSALAILFGNVATVSLWSKNEAQVLQMQQTKTNVGYLPKDILFPPNVKHTSVLLDLLECEILIIAVPTNAMYEVLLQLKCLPFVLFPDLLWVCKGFEKNSLKLPHEIVVEVMGGEFRNYGAILGSSFAEEVVQGTPTAVTLASFNTDFAFKIIKEFLTLPNFRMYANSDLIGCEVGGAIKNVIAIAVGISDGLGLGLNARAALITRSLNEINKLVVKLGGQERTIYGLAGIGDLILTCTGDLSRNRQVGIMLAKGESIDEITVKLGHVAEGVYTVFAVRTLSLKLLIDMPIVEAVYNIIYTRANIMDSVLKLLNREPKLEFI